MKIVNAALYKKAGNSKRELILHDNALPSTRKIKSRESLEVPSLLKKNHDARHCAPDDEIALRFFTLISFIRRIVSYLNFIYSWDDGGVRASAAAAAA
jgi:hypothetical protein